MTQVLVFAAHPDDAELAAGGTIASLVAQGVDVTVALFTVSDPDAREARIDAAHRAASVLGHEVLWVDDAPYHQVEEIPRYRLVSQVDEIVRHLEPGTVLTHTTRDSHADHVRLGEAVIASSRRWPEVALYQFGPNEHRTVRYEEFIPNTYIPIGDHLAKKLASLACYEYPGQGFRRLDLERVALQAAVHGAACGVAAAEAFQLVRRRVLSVVDASPTMFPRGEFNAVTNG